MRESIELTRRNIQVLERLNKGLRASDVAERLGITADAVRRHAQRCRKALGVNRHFQGRTPDLSLAGVPIPELPPKPLLTEKESEVLKARAQGLIIKEIASAMTLSPKTIETHLANIHKKLKGGTVTTILNKARALNLL